VERAVIVLARKRPLRFRWCFAVLLGIVFAGSAARAHQLDVELSHRPVLLEAEPESGAASAVADMQGDASSQQEKPVADLHQGTSNDRILWTLPNFLTVENADRIPPLTPGQKFKVVARGVFDPFEFVLIGFVAGLGQASNSNPSYGQGMQGYAKRYGTAYGDNAIENFMGSAVLPSVLHQDPRYYQLGHGGFFRRASHAVGRVVITRSDSGEKQVNYSELGGALAAAAISTYTYHPQSERGFGNVASVWASQMGWDAVTYMIKEFWPDLRKHSKRKQGAALNQQSSESE
jgi:hypothetical protein